MSKHLPLKLYLLRIAMSLNQSDAAILLHTTQKTLSNWELGVTEPNPEALQRISDLYGVSLDWLTNDDDAFVLMIKPDERGKVRAIAISLEQVLPAAPMVNLKLDICDRIVRQIFEEYMQRLLPAPPPAPKRKRKAN